jgi:diguanylate cyclase (GGDEF)-like protein/PAS domain S-box-containing protein
MQGIVIESARVADLGPPMAGGIPMAWQRVRMQWLGAAAVALACLLIAFSVVDWQALGGVSARAHLTFTAVVATAAVLIGRRAASGRSRVVRGWMAVGLSVWTVAQVIRDLPADGPLAPLLPLADLLLPAMAFVALVTYRAAIRRRFAPGTERILYLDAALVISASTAILVTAFGRQALVGPAQLSLFLHAVVFVAVVGASAVLDLAALAERRFRGAYAVLGGVAVAGVGFLGSASGDPGSVEWRLFQGVLSTGVLVVGFGCATWTDRIDDSAGYVRFATRLRELLPLLAAGAAPVLLVWSRLSSQHGSGPLQVAVDASIAVLLTFAIARQSITLRERGAVLRALRDARLADERRAQQLAGVETVGRLLASRGPTPEALEKLAAVLCGRFGYDNVAIYLTEGPLLKLGASQGRTDAPVVVDGTTGVIGRVMGTQRPEFVTHAADEGPSANAAVQSEMCVPLSAGDRLLGVIDIQATGRRSLDDTDLHAMIAVADQLASAIELGSERRFINAVIDTVGAIVVVLDENGRLIRFNDACVETSGYSAAELSQMDSLDFLVAPEDREQVQTVVQDVRDTRVARALENAWVRKDGSRRHIAWSNTVVVDDSGAVKYTIATGLDITTRKRLEEELAHRALHDAVTSLPNRTLFIDRVRHALADTRRRAEIAVLFIDIDDFKLVNDTHGHLVGDALLTEIGARIQASIRPGDTAARMGGDEFAVILERVSTPLAARAAGERLLARLQEPVRVGPLTTGVRVSIGVATARPGTASADILLTNADLAMYAAKRLGKGRCELFDSAMHVQSVEREALRGRVVRAIEADDFAILFQPIVTLEDGRVIGGEALLRLSDGEGGHLLPSRAVPVAEETGLIVPLGRKIIEHALRRAAAWRDLRGSSTAPWVSVNLSALEFQGPDLVTDFAASLERWHVDPASVVVEITESSMMHDTGATIERMHALKRLGVRIAIDDFGTGYSSLSYLRRFPIDILKIDRSFTEGITGSGKESLLVRAIIALADTLGVDVVAEGIETAEQAAILRQMGCRFGQGFLYARPLTPDQLAAAFARDGAPATV